MNPSHLDLSTEDHVSQIIVDHDRGGTISLRTPDTDECRVYPLNTVLLESLELPVHRDMGHVTTMDGHVTWQAVRLHPVRQPRTRTCAEVYLS